MTPPPTRDDRRQFRTGHSPEGRRARRRRDDGIPGMWVRRGGARDGPLGERCGSGAAGGCWKAREWRYAELGEQAGGRDDPAAVPVAQEDALAHAGDDRAVETAGDRHNVTGGTRVRVLGRLS